MVKPCLKSLLTCLLFTVIHSNAQVSITAVNIPYTQDFNALAVTGGSSVLPLGWKLSETGSTANNAYATDDGSGNTGNCYSYGMPGNSDRALGMLQTSALFATAGIQVINNTGQTVTSITISYHGEQWKCGQTGRTDRLDFQYSTSASSLITGTWIDENALDFSSPSVSATGKKDGNAAANRKLATGTITGISIATGTGLWLRWSDFNASGADDGLAIDDFSLTLHAAGDVLPPLITTLSPADNAGNVALNGNLQISFNEPVLKGTGTVVIRHSSDGKVAQIIDINLTAVSVNGTTATIPYAGLTNGLAYFIEVSAGTFRDAATNYFTGMCGNGTWNFSTTGHVDSATTLKVVNWNIEWFGHPGTDPANDNLQEQNVRKVLQNINADLFALSEVVSISRLQNIVNGMPGYAMVVSEYCVNATDPSDPDYALCQKLVFVYRTSRVNAHCHYGILRAGGSSNAGHNWGSGRFPFLLDADVTLNGTTKRILFILIHGKANTPDFVDSYKRRKEGAKELSDSLNQQYPTDHVIILGDYNDDLDRTITSQMAPDTTSSYSSMLSQPDRFTAVTLPLSLAREKSTVSHNEMIDHVVLSNEMNAFYIANSADVLRSEVETWISGYGSTTSDHYPIVTRYFFSNNLP
ncbi:MAG: Ig-like domain-containing protein [Chitinophagaceae bacterium]